MVASSNWNKGVATHEGAVTWASGFTGLTGVVTASNSLIGSAAGDKVGYGSVTALTNGNYVVASVFWSNGVLTHTGAATWETGASQITGVVSVSNSLVGSHAFDGVGVGVRALSNGDYVVSSGNWANGGLAGAGAATWGDGTLA